MKKDIVADTQVVVLMGGLGTRLGLSGIPKAMADINGEPFFNYELRLLRRWGFHKFLFLVGYQAECIKSYYKDGAEWQIEIQYSYDGKEPLGTGGALKNAEEKLEEDFLLLYGDSFMDIDYREIIYRYQVEKTGGKMGVMTILHNKNILDKSNVCYREGKLLLYDKLHVTSEMEYIDYGVSMLSKKILSGVEENKKLDISLLLTYMSRNGRLAAQVVAKRFFEIGRPDSLQEFREYAQKRFAEQRKAVFFDRDGVINDFFYNEDMECLDSPFKKDDFVYKEDSIHTLLSVQKKGYYIFIVTNQPAAAKGKTSIINLYDLNTWLMSDLECRDIHVEFINMCPHHPTGNEKTRESFLIGKCNCRKPEPGLINELLQTYNIDLKNSYMVGDSYTDVIAGIKAGLKTVFLGKLKCDACQCLGEAHPDILIENLSELEKVI